MTAPEPSTVEPRRCGHVEHADFKNGRWGRRNGQTDFEPCQYPLPEPSTVERGSQDTEALVRLHDAAMDPAGYWEERAATAEAALAAARADLATSDSALGIANERVLNAESENAALRADVDRLTAEHDEAELKSLIRSDSAPILYEKWRAAEAERDSALAEYAKWAEVAGRHKAELVVLRGQRDAALALADELAAAGALAGSRGHYEVRADALTAAREIRRALGASDE